MKLNIINLIDNLNIFNNYLNNNLPWINHTSSHQEFNSCSEFLNCTQSCLIFENKTFASIKLFNMLLEEGKRGMIITRNHPEKLNNLMASNKIDMYWLSAEDYDYVIHPWDINQLVNTVHNFIKTNNQGIILINGLEYLSTYNDPNIIFNLISSVGETISNTNAKFFVSMDPIAIGNKFLDTIRSKGDLIDISTSTFKEALF
ncbi:MAG: DUF835 domain-containing protein [Candidatus Thorarchaeota archaeon]